jgi:hypothetical protein
MPRLTTKMGPFRNLVVSAAGAETDLIAATGYAITDALSYPSFIPDAGNGALVPKNLQDMWGAGDETEANAVQLICHATSSDNDTCTMSLYGFADQGPPIYVGSIVWTFGTAIRSTGVRWADTAVPTFEHITTATAADSGNNRVASVTFDATGYKYLYGIVHTTTTGAATAITVQMRPW